MIKEDIALLEIKPDHFSFTSDFFDNFLEYADKLIQKGLAYCDDTPADQMKKDRENRVESKNRNNCKLCSTRLVLPHPSHPSMFVFNLVSVLSSSLPLSIHGLFLTTCTALHFCSIIDTVLI